MEYYFPPSMDRVEKEVEFHQKKKAELAQIFEVYKSILKVQLAYPDKIKSSFNNLSEEEIKDYFRKGKYLFSDQKPIIDRVLFLEILQSICKAILKASPKAPETLLTLSSTEEFEEDRFEGFLQDILLFDKQELEKYIEEKNMDKKTNLNSEIISFVIFMSLDPFYGVNMKAVRDTVGFSIWHQGYCPICGQTAVIAKHRKEDGARVLECWLCHAEWVYPRLECPYCDNKDQKKLRFFYVPGDKARQVHVCEICKKYLKTIDTRVLEKEVILGVEAIATGYLDVLAEREGYQLPGRSAMLN
ncbi:MAG: formate dehydrogenase accessory protein FdhE [Clostridiaceae bacterium]|jgi:FdhE protein|nr:formate dehydrogenase accessory protein FdhE [Clostridiaceae bacterium]